MFYSTVGYQGWQQLTVYFKIAKILNILHTKTWQIFEVMDTVITHMWWLHKHVLKRHTVPPKYIRQLYFKKKKVFLKINLKEMPISWLPTKEA